jgi:hypothetical protein
MTTDELKDWMRIYAVEILAVNLCAMSLLQTADPQGLAERVRKQMIEGTRRHGFAGVDPAMSDLASAELEDAANRLMEMVSEQIRVVLENRQPRTSGS